MILAEELDADFAQVVPEHAPPSDKLYGNPLFRHPGHRQFELDPRLLGHQLREAGAAARAMLLRPQPPNGRSMPASCSASNGQVTHAASSRKLSYGALADASR